jgi:MFS family permease
VAGIAVTGATLAWTAGAWVQARMNSRWEGRRLIRIGLAIVLAGIAGLVLTLTPGVPVAAAIAAWTVGGFGIGLSYAPTTLLTLSQAPAGREGWATASLSLADVLGSALGIGAGGAAISAAARYGWSLSAGVYAAFAFAAAAGVLALAVTGRLPVGRAQPAEPAVPELAAA